MIKHSEIEEIKKLIKNGFDLELMSFELDIPIEEIMQYKLELEKAPVAPVNVVSAAVATPVVQAPVNQVAPVEAKVEAKEEENEE